MKENIEKIEDEELKSITGGIEENGEYFVTCPACKKRSYCSDYNRKSIDHSCGNWKYKYTCPVCKHQWIE